MSSIEDTPKLADQRQPSSRRLGRGLSLRILPMELRILVLLVAVLGAVALGFRVWPYLHFAIAPLGLWLLAFVGILVKRPHLLRRRTNFLAASLLTSVGLAGTFTLYESGWGGSLGDRLVGSNLGLGILRVLPIFLLALFITAPRRAWRVSQATGQRGFHSALYILRITRKGLRRTGRDARRLSRSVARAYDRYPMHRPLLKLMWGGIHLPTRTWRYLRRRRYPRLSKYAQPALALPPAPGLAEDVLSEPEAKMAEDALHIPAPEKSVAVETAVSPAKPTPAVETPTPVDLLRPVTVSNGVNGWKPPPMDLLRIGEEALVPEEENQAKARLIESTLAEYGVEVIVKDIRPGPVVTQFGLVPGWVRRTREVPETGPDGQSLRDDRGRVVKSRVEEKTRVKVDTILSREKDLALALAAHSIRFEAPVPGESFVGLEVPNDHPMVVTLRSLVESPAFRSLRGKGHLPVAFGKGSGGEAVVADLAEMPHLLIAGATGSGKSVCINTIVCSLLMQFTPYDLRLMLIDPKRVELTSYQGLSHLLTPVLVEAEEALPALRGLIGEMQMRYKRFERVGTRNIQAFNRKVGDPESRMPYMVVVIDELADLMMTAAVEVEQSLCRLAQLGRATGIHLVVATQRPSVDVLTGLIKANFPSRISFVVSSHIDSRTILDGVGAEKLLGRGDMLFLPTDYIKPKRLQGAFISDEEVQTLVAHWNGQQGGPLPSVPIQLPADAEETVEDEMLLRSRDLALRHSRLSASMLQRKLGIGFARASALSSAWRR